MPQQSLMRGVEYTLQPAGSTTGNGNVIALPNFLQEYRLNIIGSAGVAGGAVQLEAANSPTYAGTWEAVGSPVTVVVSAAVAVAFTGIFQFLRARISSNITGGTVTVTLIGS